MKPMSADTNQYPLSENYIQTRGEVRIHKENNFLFLGWWRHHYDLRPKAIWPVQIKYRTLYLLIINSSTLLYVYVSLSLVSRSAKKFYLRAIFITHITYDKSIVAVKLLAFMFRILKNRVEISVRPFVFSQSLSAMLDIMPCNITLQPYSLVALHCSFTYL
jgi:hypothetical protein